MINIVNTFNQKLKIVTAHNTECYKLMKIKVENFGVVNERDESTNKFYNYLNSINEALVQDKILDNSKKIYKGNYYNFLYKEKILKLL